MTPQQHTRPDNAEADAKSRRVDDPGESRSLPFLREGFGNARTKDDDVYDYPTRDVAALNAAGRWEHLPPPPDFADDDPGDLEDVVPDLDAIAELGRAARAEREEVERARLAAIDRDPRAKAARAIGLPLEDVVRVKRRRYGVRVQLRDGSHMVVVPEDRPDAEGRTGVMLWGRPERHGYSATPMYAKTACEDLELCPHRPGAPPQLVLDRLAEQKRETERVAEEEAAAAKRTAQLGHEPWADAHYRWLIAERDTAQVAHDTASEGSKPHHRRHLDAVDVMVRSYGARLQSAWVDEHPPPPNPTDVARFTATYLWGCRMADLLAAGTAEYVIRAEHGRMTNDHGYLSRLNPFDPHHERDAASTFLEGNNLPLPETTAPA